MPEDELKEPSADDLAQEVEQGLHDVRQTLEFMQARMLTGEEVDEKELTMLARMVATQMELLRSRLEEVVGPIPKEELLEELRQEMSDEEFEEFLATEEERRAFQEEVRREETLREQLEKGENGGS